MPVEPPPLLLVEDADAWRDWLTEHHQQEHGVWLILAKKGTSRPTSLRYEQALDEALCHGWIDGQLRRHDERVYHQRFTPRRARSTWSKRNVAHIQRLLSEGRMHPAGLAEVQSAKADGRWDSAYAGPASIQVPAELAAALTATPGAQRAFELLPAQSRYRVLYRVTTAKRSETRARHIQHYVAMLTRGEIP
ncbi:MAG: YdeI/OmpD-associated family protein [Solirubrobacteraceae bacterium]